MNYVKTTSETFSFLRLCEHIGEAHLFEFICEKATKNEGFLYYHNQDNINNFEKLYGVKSSTQHKYLKLLCLKELLIKKKNGVYQPNEKYVEYIRD